MDIKKVLPSRDDFHTSGAGSFGKKLAQATEHGELENLSDNQESIVKVIDAYSAPIRRGSFGRFRQKEVLDKIKKMEGEKLSAADKKDLKEILEYLGDDSAPEPEPEKLRPSVTEKIAEKLEKRQAVKDGLRGVGRPLTKIDRILAEPIPGTEKAPSPYNNYLEERKKNVWRSASSGQAKAVSAAKDSSEHHRGTGLAGQDAHRTGLASNGRPDLGIKGRLDLKSRDLPPKIPLPRSPLIP